jgi:nicotinate phosphoribosyltransferase
VLRHWGDPPPRGEGRDLQAPVISDGEVAASPTLAEIRAHHARAIAELPASALALDPGEPAIPTRHELP